MSLTIKAGATDQTIYLFIQDSSSTTGDGLTGLAYNTASLVAYYVPQRGSATAITLATLAAANSAHSDGGFKEVDATNMPGVYRLDLPDAAVASGPEVIIMMKGATNMAPVAKEIQLVAFDPQDATGLGVSRLDAAITTRLAPTTAGRTLDVSTTGEAGIDWGNIGSPTTTVNLSGTTVKTATDVETDTQDIQSRIPAALVSGRMDSSVGAMAANTLTASALATDAVTEIQSGLSTLTAGDIPTEAEIAAAVWDEAYAGHLTSGTFGSVVANLPDAAGIAYEVWQADPSSWSAAADTFGKLALDSKSDTVAIKDVTDKLDDTLELDSTVYRFTANALEQAPSGGGGGLDAAGVRAAIGLASANLDTQLGTIDTVVDSILVDTAEIGAAGAGLTALASASGLATVAGYIDTEVAAIKAKTDNLPASPAASGDIPSASTVASAVRTELGTELGRIDASISSRLATSGYTAPPTAQANAETLLKFDLSTISGEASRSPLNALRLLRNKWSAAGGTLTVKKEDDTATAWTATLTSDGAAEPITGSDPS